MRVDAEYLPVPATVYGVSALGTAIEAASGQVLDHAARLGAADGVSLVVAVEPDRAPLLAQTLEAHAERAGISFDLDVALAPCNDLPTLAQAFAPAAGVLWTGCAVAEALAPVRAGAPGGAQALVLSTYPAAPPAHGGARRVHALWSSLPGFDATAVSIAAAGRPSAVETFGRTRELQVARPRALQEVARLVREATGISADDVAAAVLGAESLGSGLGAALTDTPELVVLVQPYLVDVAAAVGLPVVYEAHNVELDLKAAMYPDSPAGRAALEIVKRAERRALELARVVVAVSDDDRLRLHELYGTPLDRIHVVANGAAVESIPFTPWRDRRPETRCVFVGDAHRPNVEAASAVLAAARALPSFGFDVVGSVGAELGGELPANVAVHGRVSDERKHELYAGARLALNPMASGSGSNLKLVDYCSSGLPVVTTRFGARGFSDELVRELRVVEPDGFAAAIASAAAEDWSERVERARWICLERYAWSALADELAAVLRAAA